VCFAGVIRRAGNSKTSAHAKLPEGRVRLAEPVPGNWPRAPPKRSGTHGVGGGDLPTSSSGPLMDVRVLRPG